MNQAIAIVIAIANNKVNIQIHNLRTLIKNSENKLKEYVNKNNDNNY